MRRTYMGAVLLVWFVLLSACAELLPQNTKEAPSQSTAVRPPDPQGRTPLMQAAYAGDVTTVKALLARGVDVNAHDYRGGKTALMYAAFKGHVEIVQTLLAAGAEVNAKAGQLGTALTFAAS